MLTPSPPPAYICTLHGDPPHGDPPPHTLVLSHWMRLQYCEYGPDPPKCYEWMKENLPTQYARLVEGGKLFLTIFSATDIMGSPDSRVWVCLLEGFMEEATWRKPLRRQTPEDVNPTLEEANSRGGKPYPGGGKLQRR